MRVSRTSHAIGPRIDTDGNTGLWNTQQEIKRRAPSTPSATRTSWVAWSMFARYGVFPVYITFARARWFQTLVRWAICPLDLAGMAISNNMSPVRRWTCTALGIWFKWLVDNAGRGLQIAHRPLAWKRTCCRRLCGGSSVVDICGDRIVRLSLASTDLPQVDVADSPGLLVVASVVAVTVLLLVVLEVPLALNSLFPT